MYRSEHTCHFAPLAFILLALLHFLHLLQQLEHLPFVHVVLSRITGGAIL